tara:strand:+ start:3387 stop:3584 length:198 start_codon:yes stop_codon:yes gene_type:complete
MQVKLRRGETVERMIKRFSRKIKNSGILEECKNRMYYEKPSVRRRRQKIRRKKIMEKLKKESGNV